MQAKSAVPVGILVVKRDDMKDLRQLAQILQRLLLGKLTLLAYPRTGSTSVRSAFLGA